MINSSDALAGRARKVSRGEVQLVGKVDAREPRGWSCLAANLRASRVNIHRQQSCGQPKGRLLAAAESITMLKRALTASTFSPSLA